MKHTNVLYILKTIFFLFLLTLCVYLVNKLEFKRSGIGNSQEMLKVDFVFIAIFCLSVLSMLKDKFISYIIAAIPVLIFYIFFNEFYIFYNRIFKISDIEKAPNLLHVLNGFQIAIIIIIILVYIYFFTRSIQLSKIKKPFFLLGILFFVTLISYPKKHMNLYHKLNYEYAAWDYVRMVRENGYINVVLYIEARRKIAYNDLKQRFNSSDLDLNTYSKVQIKDKKNIHIIVLESFFDPNMLTNLKFSKNPIAKEFRDIIGNKANNSISPVYGGFTSQAEFEVLTGLPAFAKYNSTEFNLFTGNYVNSLPNALNDCNYETIATNRFLQEVFNSYNAYKGLGFKQKYFIKGDTYIKKKYKEQYIFDGDLFDQNVKFIDSVIKSADKPVLNYVLGIYGHMPNEIDEKRHPEFIDVFYKDAHIDDLQLKRAINQIYYRTKSLAKYINQLNEIDKNAIIIVIGDHLLRIPEIKKYGYKNIHETKAYIFKNGNAIKLEDLKYHYQIPHFISKEIFGFNIFKAKNYKKEYDKVIYQAIN